MSKVTLKNSGVAKRSDAYSLPPDAINVNHEDNPRNDYGDLNGNDEFAELKRNIKEEGLLAPVTVYIHPEHGTFHLAHGFRRMRAITELIAEGVNIEKIPVKEVAPNEETILLQHFILNSGKKLSDAELGDTLIKLSVLMGEENIAEISRRSGIEYPKVLRLMQFGKSASTQLKKLVKDKLISINNAISITKAVPSQKEQNDLIADAQEKAGKDKKLTVKDLTILQAPEPVTYSKLRGYVTLVKKSDNADLDQEFTLRLEALLNEIDAKKLTDKQIIGKYFAKTVEA